MLANKDSVRILWISDVHYKKYIGFIEDKVIFYIEEFIKEIEAVENEKNIDYILFSGDIAFDGTPENYQLFKQDIIDRLQKLFKNDEFPKIITIPGNHDVCWNETSFFEEFINNNKYKKNDFLKNKELDFKKLFKNYSHAFDSELNDKYSNFFSLKGNTLPEFQNPYLEDRLFGYIIDEKKNVLFILLNSAWYSLGLRFDEILVQHIKKIKNNMLMY